jgi:fructokinase
LKKDDYIKPVIAGFGEILWDLFPSGKQPGGAPANFTYHAGAMGAEAYPISTVGEDEYGREIISLLKHRGISDNYITMDPHHVTGSVTVNLDADGVPTYVIHENVAWDHIPFKDQISSLASRLDAVCYGSLAQRSETSRDTLTKFLSCLNPGCLKVFDINLRQHYYSHDIIIETMHESDVLKLNDNELTVIADMMTLRGTEKEMLMQLMEKFSLRLIALTKAEKGSILISMDEYSSLAALPIKIADTVGAGDAFTAAMTLGLLKNIPLERIHIQANRLAGFVCSQPGAMPVMGYDILESIRSVSDS